MRVSYSKRTPEEIAEILREFSQGLPFIEISKKYKIGESSFYRLLKNYKGLNSAEIGKLRHQDKQISRLKRHLSEREFEIKLLKKALKKKW